MIIFARRTSEKDAVRLLAMLFKIRSSSPEQVTSRAVRAITAPVLEAPYIHILIFAIKH